jgi:hypothetical protein
VLRIGRDSAGLLYYGLFFSMYPPQNVYGAAVFLSVVVALPSINKAEEPEEPFARDKSPRPSIREQWPGSLRCRRSPSGAYLA